MGQLSPPPTSFHCFGQLPPEIRYHIWTLSLAPRIIDVFAFNKKLAPDEPRNPSKDDRIGIWQRGVPILYACSESRAVALGIYTHAVDTEDPRGARAQQRRDEAPDEIVDRWQGSRWPCRRTRGARGPGEASSSPPPRIYLDLESDVVCLNRAWWFIGRHPLYSLRNYFAGDVLAAIRYLGLPYSMFVWAVANEPLEKRSRDPSTAAFPRVTLLDFPNLRELLLNVDPGDDDDPLYEPAMISHGAVFRALRHFTTLSRGSGFLRTGRAWPRWSTRAC